MNKPSYFFISLMNGAAWGGSEELWYRTALYLAQKKITVACAVYEWKEKEERLMTLEQLGCKVYRLPNKKNLAGGMLQKLFYKQKVKHQLKKLIRSLPVNDYETVIVNQGGFEVYTTPWKDFYTKLPRYVLLFHNYNEQQLFSASQKKIMKAWINRAATSLFAAQKAKEVLQKQLNFPIQKAAVFINPISFPVPDESAPYPPLKNGNYVFSVFAALDIHRKAQDKLITVLSAKKWQERNWKLHLFGEGRDKVLLQQLVIQNDLQDKVELKGHTADVSLHMRESHLVLQATNIDAMPLSVMEAMAVGRPLIGSDVGDMPLWVKENENGWLCKADINSLERCLETAWQNKNRWEAMGKMSFALFQKKFPQNVEADFLKKMEA